MSKLERLLNLTALLLNTERPLRIEEIGSLMEGYPPDPASFRRTFERDKDDLREMGIPVDVIDTGSGDTKTVGYRIRPDQYYLADPQLEPDELASLRLALGTIRLEGQSSSDTLRKLGGSPTAAGLEGVDDPAELAAVPVSPYATDVFSAIGERRLLSFTYNDELRTVEPHRLDFQRGRWYLIGFDRLRGDRRSFRLDRIAGPMERGAPDAFTAPELTSGSRFDPWRHGDDPEVVARLQIDTTQASLSRSRVGPDAVWTEQPDGSAIVELDVTNRHAFRSLVLEFLDHAVILDPPELRDDLTNWLRECVR